MVSIPDIEQWDVGVLQQVKDSVLNAGHSLRRLGDGLDATKKSLDDWHGDAAEAWRTEHGRAMVKVDQQHRETSAVAGIIDTAIEDVRWCIDELAAARAEPESLGMQIRPDGSVVDPQAADVTDENEAAQRERVRATAEERLKALLVKATATDVEIGNALRVAVADKPIQVPDGAPHTDPTFLLAELQEATNQAVIDQMAKIRGIQKQLDEAMSAAYTGGAGSPAFEKVRRLKAELATALNDLGNIPDYSNIDPKSVTVSADGHFLINGVDKDVPFQIYGQLKNGTGEFFDQAKGTSYSFKDGKLVSTNTPDPGRVTPDDELLFNAVTLAVGAPEAAAMVKGGGEAAIHGLKTLLGREAFEGAAGLTGENVLPKALAAAEARADDAATNLASHHPPPAFDRPGTAPVDHPAPKSPEHPQSSGPATESPARLEHTDSVPTPDHHSPPMVDGDVSFPDSSRPMLGSDDRYHIPDGATEIQIDKPGDLGTTITDIDRVENGVLWEEKSATSAGNPEQWVNKQFVNKMEKYIESQQYIVGLENAPIGIRFTNPGVDPALRAAVEQAAAELRAKHPGVTILVDWIS